MKLPLETLFASCVGLHRGAMILVSPKSIPVIDSASEVISTFSPLFGQLKAFIFLMPFASTSVERNPCSSAVKPASSTGATQGSSTSIWSFVTSGLNSHTFAMLVGVPVTSSSATSVSASA